MSTAHSYWFSRLLSHTEVGCLMSSAHRRSCAISSRFSIPHHLLGRELHLGRPCRDLARRCVRWIAGADFGVHGPRAYARPTERVQVGHGTGDWPGRAPDGHSGLPAPRSAVEPTRQMLAIDDQVRRSTVVHRGCVAPGSLSGAATPAARASAIAPGARPIAASAASAILRRAARPRCS